MVMLTPVVLMWVHLPGVAEGFSPRVNPHYTVTCISVCVNVNKIIKASLVAMLLYEHMELLHALVGTVSTALVAAVDLTGYTSLNFSQGINEII